MRYIFILLFLFSCAGDKSLHQSNLEILDEVILKHDELMIEMKTLKDLKMKMESLEISDTTIVSAVNNLDDARKDMMSFMKGFSEEFPYDKYPMQRDSFDGIGDKELKQINNKLQKQKEVVMEVSSKFSYSIDQAKKLLD